MKEDVNSVSPTLGFIIKTIDYEGYLFLIALAQILGANCNIDSSSTFVSLQAMSSVSFTEYFT
jgi:hypothetical protein